MNKKKYSLRVLKDVVLKASNIIQNIMNMNWVFCSLPNIFFSETLTESIDFLLPVHLP